jgi:hypothetical protein
MIMKSVSYTRKMIMKLTTEVQFSIGQNIGSDIIVLKWKADKEEKKAKSTKILIDVENEEKKTN